VDLVALIINKNYMNKKVKIYICSPYSFGDKEKNVKRQIDIGNELLNRGYVPYIPLLTHYQHIAHPREESEWLKLDFEFLLICDILIRIKPIIDGKELLSNGADQEEKLAIENKIPVFTFNTIEEMCYFLDNNKLEI
jgi:hypothetical protein